MKMLFFDMKAGDRMIGKDNEPFLQEVEGRP